MTRSARSAISSALLLPPSMLLFPMLALGFECPEGFSRHGESCYAFASGPATQTEGVAMCEQYGAMLACPLTLEEATWLGQQAANRGQDFWISTTDVFEEGVWKMPCGTPEYAVRSQAPWCPGEPNDGGGGIGSGDCARIIGLSAPGNGNCQPGLWADYRCNRELDNNNHPIGFICEINPDKQAEWWEGDDDDDDKEDEGDHNPAAIFFAVVGCLGCAASIGLNVVLWRRSQLAGFAGGRARTGVAGGMAPLGDSGSTSYRAPLQVPGAITSSSPA